MRSRWSLAVAALLLAGEAVAGERSAVVRVAVRVARPFAVRSTGASVASPAASAGGGALARVVPPAVAPGAAVLAGARDGAQRPCAAVACEVPLAGASAATIVLTVLPDGAPTALVER